MSLSTTSQQIIVEQAAAHLTPQASYILLSAYLSYCVLPASSDNGSSVKTAQIMPPLPTSMPAFTHGG